MKSISWMHNYPFQEKLGFSLTLLDIGGGFPGDSNKDILFREVKDHSIFLLSEKKPA